MKSNQFPTNQYILDRNVISVIKEYVDEKPISDPNKKLMLDFLFSVDNYRSKIYAFNSILEGQHGYAETEHQRRETAIKEEEYLNIFFKKARIDISELKSLDILSTPLEADTTEALAFLDFFYQKWSKNQVKNSIPIEKRASLSEEIIEYHNIELSLSYKGLSMYLMTCLACIYGHTEATGIVKPKKGCHYNMLNDMVLIQRFSMLNLQTLESYKKELKQRLKFSKALHQSFMYSNPAPTTHLITSDKALLQYNEVLLKITTVQKIDQIIIYDYNIEKLSDTFKIPQRILKKCLTQVNL